MHSMNILFINYMCLIARSLVPVHGSACNNVVSKIQTTGQSFQVLALHEGVFLDFFRNAACGDIFSNDNFYVLCMPLTNPPLIAFKIL